MKNALWRILSMVTLLSMLAACGGDPTPTADTAAAPTSTTEAASAVPAATDEPTAEATAEATTEATAEATADPGGAAPETDFPFLKRAEAGEFKGTKVTLFGVWVDAEADSFKAALKPFADRTGIEIAYEGTNDFETLIKVRVEGNDAPDIASFPQPGLMNNFAKDGKLIDLSDDVDLVKQNYIDSWVDLGSYDGKLYGIFYRASTKSLVWYPVPQFADAGYEIPQTWDEMLALSDKMVADGNTPWCISMEQGGVTGWVATDWVEDIMLRTAGPDTYDKWVKHEIPFNDPSVKNAAEIMGKIWFNPDYVFGGTDGILTIPVADTQTPMFESPPGCWMHRQAGWIPAFFPEGKKAGTDSNFFYLPPIDPAQGKPVLGAGDMFAGFNDRPEVRAVLEYLATPDAAKVWAELGGFISPNKGVALDWYGNDVDRAQAEIMLNATVFRFDASDLMPAEVGTGTFWTGMVDYVSGEDLDGVLQSIEDSWPKQ